MKSMSGWGVAIGVVLLAACGDDRTATRRAEFDASPAQLEFGAVALGNERVLEVTLTNSGRVPYNITGVTPSVPNVAVELDGSEGLLGPGETRLVKVRFAPAVEGRVTGALGITTDDGAELQLPLDGLGVRALAAVKTQAIDFGRVDLGTAKVEQLVVHNPTAVESVVRLTLQGENVAEFSSTEADRDVVLAPGEERALPIGFRPDNLGVRFAQAAVTTCPGCEPYYVSLQGEGIVQGLNVFPSQLLFGRVALGASATLKVTVVNQGTEDLPFNGATVKGRDAALFTVVAPVSATPRILRPGDQLVLDVTFRPVATQKVEATYLRIDVTATNAPAGLNLQISGEGGASCVKVFPPTIDFGTVPEGMSATRTADVINLCGHDVQVLEATPRTLSGGFFSLGQQPGTITVPAGQAAPIKVTFTPKAGATISEGALSVRIAEPTYTSTVEVKLKGASRAFAPCNWQMAPAALDFGAVPVGAEVTLGVTLKNVGTDQCFLGGMQLASGSDAAFTAQAVTSALVDPGAQTTLKISFKPSATGSFSGLAEGWVNHPTNNHPTVVLTGKGVQGCFALQPTTVDFGVTKLSCGPRTRAVIGVNTCSAPVQLSGALIDSPASNEFTLAAPTLPANLGQGQQVVFQVTYAPTNDGDDTAALRVIADGVSYTAGLVAKGLTKPTRTDTFVQAAQAKVDVLFVIDNSGSMMEEQQNLGRNFASFLSAAQLQGVDYQIGVTTTGIDPSPGGWSQCPGGAEGGEAGRLFPVNNSSTRIITPTTPNAAQVFANNVNVGWCHWNEQGLEAAYRALSTPLVNSADDPRTSATNDGNAGFLRKDAKLAIVFLSDEEDYSTQALSTYETFFKAVKGNDPSALSISAIVGPTNLSTCPTASSSGNRYISLANATGGVVESICTNDWASSLQNLSSTTFGPRRRFALAEKPSDPAQIVVEVNGVPVTGSWTYDQATNAVVFGENQSPAAGSVIQITYPLGC